MTSAGSVQHTNCSEAALPEEGSAPLQRHLEEPLDELESTAGQPQDNRPVSSRMPQGPVVEAAQPASEHSPLVPCTGLVEMRPSHWVISRL